MANLKNNKLKDNKKDFRYILLKRRKIIFIGSAATLILSFIFLTQIFGKNYLESVIWALLYSVGAIGVYYFIINPSRVSRIWFKTVFTIAMGSIGFMLTLLMLPRSGNRTHHVLMLIISFIISAYLGNLIIRRTRISLLIES